MALLASLGIGHTATAQVQIGADIDGEAAGDYSGYSVSMPDAYTVAIGAPKNNGNGADAGHVRIYSWNGSIWVQKGTDIDGETAGDNSGWAVSMPDSNTVAIGAPTNDDSGMNSGQVRIYEWDGTNWLQKGAGMDGEADGDFFGYSVCMPDASTVAIGAIYNDGNGSNAGHVRVYSWNGSGWVQKGDDLDGEGALGRSGYSVNMPDANTVAIGTPNNSINGSNAGHVRVYSWNGSSWLQKGVDIDGEFGGDQSGWSVSMPDASTAAIGGVTNSDNGMNCGQVRIYAWDGSNWLQKGADLDGEAAGDQSGTSVSMPDINTVAIGAIGNFGNGTGAGQVRVYSWDGDSWEQLGVDLDGEAADDRSGTSVSMPDANTVAIGAEGNDGNGTDAGHVRVYSLNTVTGSNATNGRPSTLTLYPNPTSGPITVALGQRMEDVRMSVRNAYGQEVQKQHFPSAAELRFTLEAPEGVYSVSVTSQGHPVGVLKVVRR